jgi:hypothetical protein
MDKQVTPVIYAKIILNSHLMPHSTNCGSLNANCNKQKNKQSIKEYEK